ncbi:MAG TPA: hypothetical protein VK645_04430 [Chitinophagaceae bacterium]|nr:hypothetical protein [Chitinophagaceae bacterium]
MKNEQQDNNSQNRKQDTSNKQDLPASDQSQKQKSQKQKEDWTHTSTGNDDTQSKTNQPGQSSSQSQGNEKSNISVGNDGKIGKAHDQWGNDNNNRNNDPQKNQQDQPLKSDKTVTEPEIDAPIYDPEKTEKKIPQMGKNDKK